MNKSEVIQEVARAAEVGRQEAEKVMEAFFDKVRSAVGKGDRVAWPGFGSFSASDRQARTGRNPRTGEPVSIAASRVMRFSSSTALKSALNPAPAKGAKKGAKKSASKKSASTAKSVPAKKSAAKSAPASKKSASTAKSAPAKAPAKKSAAKSAPAKAPAKKSTKKTAR